MKRFWLLLLLCVLPLQMSWAAVHVCSESLAAAAQQGSAQVAAQSDVDTAGHTGDSVGKAHAADSCCTGAHGCHGLHSLMPAHSLPFMADAASQAIQSLDGPAERGPFGARVERPKWHAA